MKQISTLLLILCVYSTVCLGQGNLKKVANVDVANDSTAVIKYEAYFKLNMASAKKNDISLLNIETGKTYWPSGMNDNKEIILRVPEGQYRLSKLVIKHKGFPKCVSWIPEQSTYVYGHSNSTCSSLKTSRVVGTPTQGGIITGDMALPANPEYFATIQVESSKVYSAGEINLIGKVESMFNDLPNLIIKQDTDADANSGQIRLFTQDEFIIDRSGKK